ncbi:unnamed protein product [Gemmata massiliana]|uniref:Uncharacterized protein n=1 Tax=Gemmata massiliana TaxID=1210884 RepID=A0A6P2CRZ3_9BACT|nr:unnamed protein product [Gemmata massiliana]
MRELLTGATDTYRVEHQIVRLGGLTTHESAPDIERFNEATDMFRQPPGRVARV